VVHVRAGRSSSNFCPSSANGPPASKPPKRARFASQPGPRLSLRRTDGTIIADFGTAAVTDLRWDPWAACNVAVDPVTTSCTWNCLATRRIETDGRRFKGVADKVFALQHVYGPGEDDARAGIAEASILMGQAEPGGEGKPTNQKDLRLAELARLGLVNNRRMLSKARWIRSSMASLTIRCSVSWRFPFVEQGHCVGQDRASSPWGGRKESTAPAWRGAP